MFCQAARSAGAIASDLGNPVDRRPRTAILNAVKFHTEVVASLVYHFGKMNHNVTVFSRDDELGIEAAIHPFHFRGFRRWERFFETFFEFDVVVLATFPTCHLETLAQLHASGLPQRYFAMVHNPELLAAVDGAAATTAAAADARLLTIAPHVTSYTNVILEVLGHALHAEWMVPLFPVLFPEDCGAAALRSPSGPTWKQPACNRTALGVEDAADILLDLDSGRRLQGVKKPAASSVGASPALRRHGFCVQGKLDPSRRDYETLFSEIASRRKALLASEFSLVVEGKGGGRNGTAVLSVPGRLEEEGLVRTHTALPFQQYYEVLHGCVAIMPLFASEAYYVSKGSSSVAAALIAGTPLVATPRLLRAYSFLDASSVFLVPEGTGDVDAMQAILALPPETARAKAAALGALRRSLYDRNLATLQAALGEAHSFKRRVRVRQPGDGANGTEKGGKKYELKAMWYDFSSGGPRWTAE